MEITARPTPESVAAVNDLFDRLRSLGERLGPVLVDTAIAFAQYVVADIFEGEGVSGIIGGRDWAPLKKRTQRERIALNLAGIGAEHPILYRTGGLMRSIVMEGDPNNVVEKGRVGPGRWRGRLGTSHEHFEELQRGRDAPTQMHARPMWPVGGAEVRFAARLGEVLRQVVEDKL